MAQFVQKIFFIFFLLFSYCLYGQHTSLPLNRTYLLPLEKKLVYYSNTKHTSFKPFINHLLSDLINIDSVYQTKNNTFFAFKNDAYLVRKLRKEHFIDIKKKNFTFIVNPIINFKIGKNNYSGNNFSTNTRGFSLQGVVNGNFSFRSSFYENQSFFNNFLNAYVEKNYIVPGQGRVKPFNETGFDYASVSGLINYTYLFSNKIKLNTQFGHGKNFIGHGYRSLLLSDNTYPYLFLKFTTKYKKIQYTNLFTSLIDLGEYAKHSTKIGGFDKKWASFHLLSWLPNHIIEISLFEGIIFGQNFNANFINPIILNNSLFTSANTILGLNFKYKISRKSFLYTQFAFDDFAVKKYAYQVGYKIFNVFNIRNLHFNSEFSQAQPYMYSSDERLNNYSHYQEALAHPLGANFKEWVNFLNYRYKNLLFEIQVNFANYGKDTLDFESGKNIFSINEEIFKKYTNGQGLKTDLIYQKITFSYLINPKSNLKINLKIVSRREKNDVENLKTKFYYISISTDLDNFYTDF